MFFGPDTCTHVYMYDLIRSENLSAADSYHASSFRARANPSSIIWLNPTVRSSPSTERKHSTWHHSDCHVCAHNRRNYCSTTLFLIYYPQVAARQAAVPSMKNRDDIFIYAVIRRPTYWILFFPPVMRGEAPREGLTRQLTSTGRNE